MPYFQQADIMYFSRSIFLAALLVAANCVTISATAKRPGDTWHYYYFDGRAFVAGRQLDGGRSVALRKRMRPVVLSGMDKFEGVELAPGKGAIAGICYIQSSGGKLAPFSGYTPLPRTPVRIFSGSKLIETIHTDEQGYFIATLDAGRYLIESGAARIEVVVDNGITMLVPLRTGKRMVD